ncbi:MAG: cell division protein FtsA [Flavobacteriales bacterium CG_4_9_14_0_2_um_filter_35_242]|nr:cell division protein FtsA [Zetaproteobacteria bacterium]NDK17884.1 cell division protein FtsA [Flavobacteriales bacterium]OIO09721.1 MAG: cell division protein FtsA [Flavobacteriaceae bacterium CG1_02_35_72]PIR14759.1 MAG: cell division protein FtsA [Flavobacteriales bacterium CG11_big_fil_rev_8_21_14_0_20_35_7]PIV16076.1 MAG: cell division protein FtsA [Flavobacteriales bacterium CG03_land_8_20_14_0_80_35_15]PJA05434.1 MAG: cell division protein FtsA [Flavobacteriales bacterium CG_4_10_14
MEQNNIAVGLDIGTTKIVAMIGRKNEYNKIEVLGIGKAKSLGVHRGVVNNITQTIQSIQQAVEEAEDISGIKIAEVVVGIAGQHIRSLQHSDYITRPNAEEVINEEDIEKLINQVYKLVMLPGEEIIHVLPQEFKVDGQAEVKEPIGMYGARVEANFHVVVGQVSSIRNIGRCIKSAGLKLSSITLEPLASASAVLNAEEKEAGVALIDIGGGTTDLAIFKDGIIRHTSVIPFGGNMITEDIKEGCSIIEKQAELLKTKFGSAWPGENKDNEIVSIPGLRGRDPKEITLKNLSKIINARVVEIIEQVYQEIKNYGHEEPKKKLIAGIVLTGGGAQLKHIKQLVEYITGMDTRIGYPNEHLASDSNEDLSSPAFATAVGLLMNGLNKKNTNNFNSQKEDNAKADTKTEETIVEASQESVSQAEVTEKKEPKKSIFDKWGEKFRDFLDNAE